LGKKVVVLLERIELGKMGFKILFLFGKNSQKSSVV
jgi:hypothetical protein